MCICAHTHEIHVTWLYKQMSCFRVALKLQHFMLPQTSGAHLHSEGKVNRLESLPVSDLGIWRTWKTHLWCLISLEQVLMMSFGFCKSREGSGWADEHPPRVIQNWSALSSDFGPCPYMQTTRRFIYISLEHRLAQNIVLSVSIAYFLDSASLHTPIRLGPYCGRRCKIW